MDRLLYIPGNSFSPQSVAQLPSERTAVEILRDHFEVDLFYHPWLKGGPQVEPGWQSYVDLIRGSLTPGVHVLVRAMVSPFVMLALDANDRVGSFISSGFAPPRATLMALDQKVLADAREASASMPPYQFAKYLKADASAEEVSELSDLIERQMDRDRERAFDNSLETVDLTSLSPRVLVPTLYLEAPFGMAGQANDLFLELIPHAVSKQLEHWFGSGESAGEELARVVIEFTRGLGAEVEVLTLLMIDIVDSTQRALAAGERGWAEKLAQFNRFVRQEMARQGGREVDNAGDGFLLAFTTPGQALRCALAARASLADLDLTVRMGLNSGEVRSVAGKPSGLPLHIVARIAGLASPGEILTSQTVQGLLVGSQVQFEDRGEHELKGVPGRWRLFALGPVGQPT